jgi:hypothetical protein
MSFFRAQAKALIQPEVVTAFSSVVLVYYCLACRLSRSGFSVKEKRMMRTVERGMLELNCWMMKSLKALKVIVGNGTLTTGAAEATGNDAKTRMRNKSHRTALNT